MSAEKRTRSLKKLSRKQAFDYGVGVDCSSDSGVCVNDMAGVDRGEAVADSVGVDVGKCDFVFLDCCVLAFGCRELSCRDQ